MGYVPPRLSETHMSYVEMFNRGRMDVDELRDIERQWKERYEAPFWNATTISGAIIVLCCFSWMAGLLVGYSEGIKDRAAVEAEIERDA